MFEITIYILTILAFLVAAIGIYEIVRTLRAIRQLERATAKREVARQAFQDAIKKHAKRRHLRADLRHATNEMLIAEGRVR